MKYTIMTKNSIPESIRDNDTKSRIPLDERNSDYEEYLKWEAIEGNDASEEEV